MKLASRFEVTPELALRDKVPLAKIGRLLRHGREVEFVRYPREANHGLSRSGPPDLDGSKQRHHARVRDDVVKRRA